MAPNLGGGVGRLLSGTHEARYRSNSSSSMSEKLLRTDSAGEAMFACAFIVLFVLYCIVLFSRKQLQVSLQRGRCRRLIPGSAGEAQVGQAP